MICFIIVSNITTIMKLKKLEMLVEEIKKEYDIAKEDYDMSSMFSSGGHLMRVEMCKNLVNKINKIYGTKYSLEMPKLKEPFNEVREYFKKVKNQEYEQDKNTFNFFGDD
jgi:hypothetical protein